MGHLWPRPVNCTKWHLSIDRPPVAHRLPDTTTQESMGHRFFRRVPLSFSANFLLLSISFRLAGDETLNKFSLGNVFYTFTEFSVAFREYQDQGRFVIVSKNASTIESHNKNIKNESNKLPLPWRYKNIQFECKHYDDHKSCGNGQKITK